LSADGVVDLRFLLGVADLILVEVVGGADGGEAVLLTGDAAGSFDAGV